MLAWAKKPTQSFTDFLNWAFEQQFNDNNGCALNNYTHIDYSDREFVEKNYEKYFKDDEVCSHFFQIFPRKVIKQFGGYYMLLKSLWDIHEYHNKKEVYHPSDYHYLLLYYLLKGYVEYYNNVVSMDKWIVNTENSPLIKNSLTGKDIEELDWDNICDEYFHDLDFLESSSIITRPDIATMMRMNPETPGLVNGMMPHSDELKFKIETNKEWLDTFEKSIVPEYSFAQFNETHIRVFGGRRASEEELEKYKDIIYI